MEHPFLIIYQQPLSQSRQSPYGQISMNLETLESAYII